MSTTISFNSNSLQTSSILTSSIVHESLPNKNQGVVALAHADRSVIAMETYPSKNIKVIGKVIGTSVSDLDTKLDTFRGYFRGKEKNLDIGYAGGTRRYIATLSGIAIDRPGGLFYANFEAEFICTRPFGRNTTTTSALTATARTASSYTDTHTFLGSAPYQLPIITITINSVTDGDNSITFTNGDNGQGITVTGPTFTAGDVLVINCEESSVTLNDEEIDFLGAFTEFETGVLGSMSYSDEFTARNFDIDVDYYPLYY